MQNLAVEGQLADWRKGLRGWSKRRRRRRRRWRRRRRRREIKVRDRGRRGRRKKRLAQCLNFSSLLLGFRKDEDSRRGKEVKIVD